MLRCSGAPLWGNCSGAYHANLNKPNIDTDESREGTAAHWVGEQVLKQLKLEPKTANTDCGVYLNKLAPNGVIIDRKIIEGVQVYIDDVVESVQAFDDLESNTFDFLVEHSVSCPSIHPLNVGTLDCAVYFPYANKIILWDYKNGHRQVKAKDNLQLINYAKGLIEKYNINGLREQTITISMRVVHPYCYAANGSITEYTCLLSDLRAKFNQLKIKAYEALNNPLMTSGEHCRDCYIIGKCSTARQYGYNLMTLANQPYDVDKMSNDDLCIERSLLKQGLKVIEERINAIDDDIDHKLRNGEQVGNLQLESKKGRLKWNIPIRQAIKIAAQFGVDANVEAVLTPTQTLAKLGKNKNEVKKALLGSAFKHDTSSLKITEQENSITQQAFKTKT